MNTNLSENSEITADTNRLINSEISSKMLRKLEELKSDLNSHILDVINSALEEKVLPSIKNVMEIKNSAKNTNLGLRSDGPHPSNFSQVRPQRDFQSNGLHPENVSQVPQDAQKDFPSFLEMKSNRVNHCRENLENSNRSDDDDGYDTGALHQKINPRLDK